MKIKNDNLNIISRYKNYLRVIIILGLFIITTLGINAQSTLTETYDTPEGNFKIYYTSDTTTQPINAVTRLQVVNLGEKLQSARSNQLGYGFNDPGTTKNVEVIEQGKNAHGGCGGMNFDPYWLDGGIYGTSSTLTEKDLVTYHEFMHVVQFCYAHSLATGGGAWITEGQARMSQDKYTSAIDAENGTDIASYFGQVNGYLGNPDRPLFDLSYDAALFWAYVAEKYGSITTEPNKGIDVLVQFWESLESFGDSHPTIEMVFEDMFNELGYPDQTLEEVYKDFIVANFAKDISGSPVKYHYIDETQSPGSYNMVTLNRDESVANESFKGGVSSVSNYQPKYFRFTPDPTVRRITIEFVQYTGERLFYDIITRNATNTFSERRYVSQNLSVTLSGEYSEILLIVSGLNTRSTVFNYFVSTGSQKKEYLQILTPTKDEPAVLGYYMSPQKFVAIVVVNNGTTAIRGLARENFQASSSRGSMNILTVLFINGLYFLEIQPISGPTHGWAWLTISVRLNTALSTSEEDAVLYESMNYNKRFNTMIVFDKSASMASNEKSLAAKAAARLYTNSIPDGNYIGLVQFATNANVVVNLDNVTDNRDAMITGINNIVVNGGSTSIGDGIFSALNELETVINATAGPGTDYRKMIVLTDGDENNAKYIGDVFWMVVNNRTHFYSVVVGNDAEGDALQNLAETAVVGGTYYAFEPASGTIANDLADSYRTILKDDTNEYTIYKNKAVINSTNWKFNEYFSINAFDKTTIVLNYRAKNLPIKPELILPNGTAILPAVQDHLAGGIGHYGHFIWKLPVPLNGYYNITLQASSDYFEYYVEASTFGSYSANIYFGATKNERVRGNPMPIITTLSDNLSSIKNAQVTARIYSGTNYRDIFAWNMSLYDDGMHNDMYANDGIYGTIFYPTIYEGGYIVDITASGTDNNGKPFIIFTSESFIMKQAGDKDQDGLPDNWEARYGMSTSTGVGNDGPNGDIDVDGLINSFEFLFGSNPLLDDTDFGGEGDYGELLNGHDPNDFKDDVLRSPYLTGIPGNGNNTVFFAYDGTYSKFGLYRSDTPTGPFTIISSTISPLDEQYVDLNLTNGHTYYYKMLGLTSNNRLTGYSNLLSLTPKVDTKAPQGMVLINNNEKHTDNRIVTVNFFSMSPDIAKIELADNPKFLNKVDFSPNNSILWNLGAVNGLKAIYYRFIDTNSNIGGYPNAEYGIAGIYLHDPTPYTAPTTSSSSSTSSTIPFLTAMVFISAIPVLMVYNKKRNLK
jgi:hypothetical protein